MFARTNALLQRLKMAAKGSRSFKARLQPNSYHPGGQERQSLHTSHPPRLAQQAPAVWRPRVDHPGEQTGASHESAAPPPRPPGARLDCVPEARVEQATRTIAIRRQSGPEPRCTVQRLDADGRQPRHMRDREFVQSIQGQTGMLAITLTDESNGHGRIDRIEQHGAGYVRPIGAVRWISSSDLIVACSFGSSWLKAAATRSVCASASEAVLCRASVRIASRAYLRVSVFTGK